MANLVPALPGPPVGLDYSLYAGQSESQHFFELMTHIDHGNRQLVPKLLEIGQHFLAARGVERSERLIEQ